VHQAKYTKDILKKFKMDDSKLKDRSGDQRGGGEWEPIKFFLKMGTPTRRMQLPKHIFDTTSQVGQYHVATGVLLVLGTNNHLYQLENAAEQATRAPLNCTGQTSEQHRSDWSLLKQPKKFENFHRRPLQ
jgi:hypothetical protein